MIPILYAPTETEFTSNGLGKLSDASSCVVTEERNGIFELEMGYPMDGVHFSDIAVDTFIKTICNAKKKEQLFRVYSISKPINGKCTIRAEHVSYQMLHIPLMPFTAVGASATFAAIPSHVIGDCPFTFWTDIESNRRYSLNYPKSLRGALQGDQWSILQNFGGDYEWDNWTVKLHAQRGEDKGVILRYGKNIVDLKQEENIQKTYTGIVPFWYGFEGEDQVLVTLPEVALYASTASNFPYSRILPVDFTDQVMEKPTVEELRTLGNNYITRNEIGYPSVSISLSFVDLSQTEEYKDLATESLNLCDIIHVQFSKLGISKKAKITRTKYDVLRERYTNLYIGESYHSLASIIANNTQLTQTVQATANTRMVSALDQATQVINGSLEGAYQKTITDANGNPVGTIWMDSPDESTAVNCIRINANGIGFSTSGPNGPYNMALLIDGTLDAQNLNVVNLVLSHLTSYADNNNTMLDSEAGYLDIRRYNASESRWEQRVGIYRNTVDDRGEIRLSSGDVNENGDFISGGSAVKSIFAPEILQLGYTRTVDGYIDPTSYTGHINAGTIRGYKGLQGGDGTQSGKLKLSIVQPGGTFSDYYVEPITVKAADGKSVLAIAQDSDNYITGLTTLSSTQISDVGASVTFDMKGYSAILVQINAEGVSGRSHFEIFPAGNYTGYFRFHQGTNWIQTQIERTGTSVTIYIRDKGNTNGNIGVIYGIR